MLRAAVEAAASEAEKTGLPRTKVLAVTVLTSISESMLHNELKVSLPVNEYVPHLARIAYEAGCDGVIGSPQEIQSIRRAVPASDFLIITPGVRPAGSDRGDQARVSTPEQAVRDGADYVVIGRPIVAAPDPVVAAQEITEQIRLA